MTLFHATDKLKFPNDFLFGAATAAYQIEGAIDVDGRGPSIWDTFSHTKGRVVNGDTGDFACNHYHLWQQDLDILASLGVDAYRFSIAWPRIFPDGSGAVNKAGLGFYDQLIDGCLQRGIKIFPTLYHWDLPQWLYDRGGWRNRETADAFAHYASTVVEALGDRIDALTTFNEPWCSSILGHLLGVHAPGERNLEHALQVIHGQHLAHGKAIQAIRASHTKLPLGIVLNAQAIRPATDSLADQQAVDRHHDFHNGLFFDPLFRAEYPATAINELGRFLPPGWQDDIDTIYQPLDFWGLNYYTPEYVADEPSRSKAFPHTRRHSPKNVARTDIGWQIEPNALTELLVKLYKNYNLPPCYITENGAAFNEGPENGVVDDRQRINYLASHLEAVGSAIRQGVHVKGYFAWSLLDNFEWAEGYSMRFGLVYVDYETQQRLLKNSACWYRDLMSFNG